MNVQEYSDTVGQSSAEDNGVPSVVAEGGDGPTPVAEGGDGPSTVAEGGDVPSKVAEAGDSAPTAGIEELAQGLKSILKVSGPSPEKGAVKFADEQERPFLLYKEPGGGEWRGVKPRNAKDILDMYIAVCKSHRTFALEFFLKQLRRVETNHDHSAILDLVDLNVDIDVMLTLDCIFENVNFKTIYLGKCGNHAQEMFEMMSYYDPTYELIVSEMMLKDDLATWHYFAVAISRCKMLKSLSFREVSLANPTIHVLFEEGINVNESITHLRLDGCIVHRTPYFKLIDSLMFNHNLVELHLCYTELFTREMETIGKYLVNNRSLKILDFSNDKIGDKGIDTLANAMLEQTKNNFGINILLLYGNKLTRRCSKSINKLIACCTFLHTLNIGNNNLTDEVLVNAKEYLLENNTLLALGLQSTMLSCITIAVFEEVFHHNGTLQYLNLKGNKAIQPTSLATFADVVQRSGLIHIELDDISRYCVDPQQFVELVNRIRGIVAVNRNTYEPSGIPQEVLYTNYLSYLSCEPLFVPKELPPATSRAPTKGRFSVEPVPESAIGTPRVMTTKPKPKGTVLKRRPPPPPMPESPVFPKPIPLPSDLKRRLEEVLGAGDMYTSKTTEEEEMEALQVKLSQAAGSGDFAGTLRPQRYSSPPPRWERYAASSTVSTASEPSSLDVSECSEEMEEMEDIYVGYPGVGIIYPPVPYQQGRIMYHSQCPRYGQQQMFPMPGTTEVAGQGVTPPVTAPLYVAAPSQPGMQPAATALYTAPGGTVYPIPIYPFVPSTSGIRPANVPVHPGEEGEGSAEPEPYYVVEEGGVPEAEDQGGKK